MIFFNEMLHELEQYQNLVELIKNKNYPISIEGLSNVQKVHIAHACSENKPFIFIAKNRLSANEIYEDLKFFAKDVVLYPERELLFYDVDALSRDILNQRLEVMNELYKNPNTIIVTTVDAVIQKIAPKELYNANIINIENSRSYKLEELIESFVSMGYERTSLVEGKGQFSVRGGIVDIYCPSHINPVRIELFGDDIDSIRRFDITNQRSIEVINEITIYPATEFVVNTKELSSITDRINSFLQKVLAKPTLEKPEKEKLEAKVKADIEYILNGRYHNKIDRYFEFFYTKSHSILDYISKNYLVFLDEPENLTSKMQNTQAELEILLNPLIDDCKVLASALNVLYNENDFYSKTISLNTINLRAIEKKYVGSSSNRITIKGREVLGFNNSMDNLAESLKACKNSNKRILILGGTQTKAKTISEELKNRDIENIYKEELDILPKPSQIVISHGALSAGFEYEEIGFILISDKELFGHDRKKDRKLKRSSRVKNLTYEDLGVGDFVVHYKHGIGQYVGINTLTIENVTKDYFKIRYLNDDYLYIPTAQLDSIQKYIGSEGKAPKLNKMGSSEWAKTKSKVKSQLEDIAKELINVYAQREAQKGFAYSSDTVWQNQFEEEFTYEETNDQLICIEEIKKDMEKNKPMDRLLCGDVGFGKTEVAMRAAFKTVMDGKQVAYLVPTTVLASQHYKTFYERMKSFPVKIAMLSRLKSVSEQKRVLKALKAGNIDILIGTHKILQKNIEFKDLGLLIIDEEQKFGVSHKEKIKMLKSSIDVLTLSATPIPRTLHMSMVGIRDISVIHEPPQNRHPVQTYVFDYDKEIIKEAIERELARGGQVYYLSNRVNSIYKVAEEIKNLVPGATIGVGHGQMNPHELEDVMFRFTQNEFDILVCTTIIESGLDIPNANTMIIEDADKMGLAQLYQIRGRVGRSNRLAYAYITYRKDKSLSEIAQKRLKAIKEFTEFGSGFKIAMRDLEIRGAGNMLGAQQHGHMEAVGYDMYCRLLNEAVKEQKGIPVTEEIETQIELNVSAFISDSYINDINQKIEMYKKIAACANLEEVDEIYDSLVDRFSDPPKEVENLLEIARIKVLSKELNIVSVITKGENIVICFNSQNEVDLKLISQLIPMHKNQLFFSATNPPYLTYKPKKEEIQKPKRFLENIKILLQNIKNLKFA